MKIGDVARLAGVTVRTLHHYDEIGLLTPSQRSDAGYRLYTDADLERLQQILFYRELGFGLEQIADVMNAPDFDRRAALLEQRRLLEAQIRRLQATLNLVDKTMAAIEGGIALTKEEMFEVFGDFDPTQYEDEVRERWGRTDAYKESARRAKQYTKADWERFKDENVQINTDIIRLIEEGVAATDVRAMDAVERHRMLIDRWFYPCSREMHARLSEMYVADERFRRTYEEMHPGMAQYMYDAIHANLARE